MREEKLSSATSKRATERGYVKKGAAWVTEFRLHDLGSDFAYEEGAIGVTLSAVNKVSDTYYAWHTKGTGKTAGFGSGDPEAKIFPWDKT